ncbi:MAG: WD40/YVTN/BNR-like repeat-containing protein [Longimicrobiales bacterium]
MANRTLAALVAAALVPFLAAPAAAQQAPPDEASGSVLVASLPDSAVLAELAPRNIGPAVMSGRISDIAVARADADRPEARLGRVMYAASAGGGVWKTTNGGKTWAPVFEDEGASSIGDVAVAPSDPDVVWVGTGESNNLRSSSWGDGIYRSTDGGETWTHMGLRETQHIARIVIHPTNPDIVYVASPGPLWADGGERGVFKTTDGGRTWSNVKSISANTGFTDLVMDPTNPEVLYAAAYQRERRSYSFLAGGPESGIWKTTDGGATWTELTAGLPTGDMGRIGLDVARSQPRTVYAVVHADSGGVFRTDDGGSTWTRQSSISSIPWFFGQIRVDPLDVERVYFLGQQLQVSDDGGNDWRRIAGNTHADQHAMWIDPKDSHHLVIGNDGGLFVSYDRGESWDFAVNLPVSTFYAIAYDLREPFYYVYGGLQDNGTWAGPVATRNSNGINNDEWFRAGGGDGFYAAIDPTDPYTAYVESQNGNLRRVDVLTGETKSIRPDQEEGEPDLRWNWSAPLLISPHDHNTLYFAANHLFRSRDRGDTWERLGADLTRALDRDTLPIMGRKGPGGLGRHDGTAPFGNIATIDESPIRAGLLVVGTDDGVIQTSRDGGANWTRIDRFPGVPDLTYVSRVVASVHDENTLYATFDGHRDNDFAPYVLKSIDFGRTWTSISSNLPAFGSVQVILEHPRNPNLLFAGTEFGAFVSVDGGSAWAELALPTVAVHDLLIHPRENDLIIGTHGRGIWVLDDVTPLERLAETRQTRMAHLFAPRPVMIFNRRNGGGNPGDRVFEANNPPAGAILSYYVPPSTPQGSTLTLAMVNGAGDVVRELEASPLPGMHRTAWNLRWASAAVPQADEDDDEDEEEDEGPRFGGGPEDGPYVAAGDYAIELRSATGAGEAEVVSRTTLTVRPDPLVRLTVAELAELQQWRMKAYRAQVEANHLVAQLDSAHARIAADSAATSPGGDQRSLLTGIDGVLVALRGPRRDERRPFGGNGDDDANPSITERLDDVAEQIATLHFLPTPDQKSTIDEAVADLANIRGRASQVLQQASSGGGSD